MSMRKWMIAFALAALVLGCEKKETAPAKQPSADADKTKTAVTDVMNKASETAKEATDKLVTEAQAKLDQVTQYIKDNKLDAADKALTEVEKIKDKLPEAVQTKVADARKMLDNAKASAAKVPVEQQ